MKQRHPAQRQPRMLRRAEGHLGDRRLGRRIDVRLEEAVEEHHRVRAAIAQRLRDPAHAGVERAELDGDRELDGLAHGIERVVELLLDRARIRVESRGDGIVVQLDAVHPGVGQLARVLDPRARRHGVEAGDQRHGHRLARALDPEQVLLGLAVRHAREVAQGLAEGLGPLRQGIVQLLDLVEDLLLEERPDDQRAASGTLDLLDLVDTARDRAGRRHDRIAQRDAHVRRFQICHDRTFSRALTGGLRYRFPRRPGLTLKHIAPRPILRLPFADVNRRTAPAPQPGARLAPLPRAYFRNPRLDAKICCLTDSLRPRAGAVTSARWAAQHSQPTTSRWNRT